MNELRMGLSDRQVDVRSASLEALVSAGGAAAADSIAFALLDKDDAVRRRALALSVASGIELPVTTLMALALYDPAPAIRLEALRALDRRSDPSSVARVALYDADPLVRCEAESILVRPAAARRHSAQER